MLGQKRYKVTGEVTDANLATFHNVYVLAWLDDEQRAREFAAHPPADSAAIYGRRYLFDTAQHWAAPEYSLGVFLTPLAESETA